jgi:glycosyltransferase involved in cell wall biosynthesis
LAHLLRDAGYEVAVLSGMPNYPTGAIFPGYTGKTLVTEQMAGITVHRMPFAPSNSHRRLVRTGSLISLSRALLRHGKEVLESFRPHWMIVSSPPLPLALCGAWLARRSKVPFLLNVSDLWPLTAKELGALRAGPIYHTLQRAERWLFGQAEGYMAQSEEILAYLHQRQRGSKPQFLYRNLPTAIPVVPQPQLPERTHRRIVYAGLIGPVQGILKLVQEVDFARHQLTLDVYGDGADREALEAFVNRHPDRGVVYKGLVAPGEMFRMLPQYDFALSSLRTAIYGAVPSKIYSALAAGVPTVFLGTGEGAELLRQHQLGWVSPPGDAKALDAHLSVLAALPEAELIRMRQHIAAVNASQFNPQQQQAGFLAFFRNLTGRTAIPER